MKTKKSFDTYAALALAVQQIKPEQIDMALTNSLRQMLYYPAFKPIAEQVEQKIHELEAMLIEQSNTLNAAVAAMPADEPVEVWMGAKPETPIDPNKTGVFTEEQIQQALEDYRRNNPDAPARRLYDFKIILEPVLPPKKPA